MSFLLKALVGTLTILLAIGTVFRFNCAPAFAEDSHYVGEIITVTFDHGCPVGILLKKDQRE